MSAFRSRRLLITGASLAFALAACGGGTPAAAPADGGSADVTLTGTDSLKFEPTSASAAAGEVTITLTSEATVEHNVVIEELGEDPVVEAAAGQTASGTVELEAGEYTFYCSIPAHRQAGMEGTLTVQ